MYMNEQVRIGSFEPRKLITQGFGTIVKYLAAYLLLVNAGNTSPSADDIKKVLESVSIEVDDEKVSKLLSEVEGKSAEELIAEGNEKLSSVPTGAPAGGAAAAGSGSAEAAEEEAPAAEEESDDDMGFGLFD